MVKYSILIMENTIEMTQRLKDSSISPRGIQPELLLAISLVLEVYRRASLDFVITSLNDSKHSWTSLHYAGAAVDFRTHDSLGSQLSQAKRDLLVEEIKRALGFSPDYDVIGEKDHIHLEYQPKWKN